MKIHPDEVNSQSTLVGILVGGESRRMGQPKGLLLAPGSDLTLVERVAAQASDAFGDASCVLVGDNVAYDRLGFRRLSDRLPNQGPLGGVVALLAEAQGRGAQSALALGCDFPYVSSRFLRRLVEEGKDSAIVCPHLDGRYQPLVARYSVCVLPAFRRALDGGERALQPLLRTSKTFALSLTPAEEESLVDWDCPQDMTRLGPTTS